MAFGVDFPHLDKKAIKQDVEEKLRCELSGDYLKTFELGTNFFMASVSNL